MNKTLKQLLIVGTLFFISSFAFSQELEGTWQGRLVFLGRDMRIVFHISKNNDSLYAATMDSPDQGARNLEVDEIEKRGDSLFMQMYDLNGAFAGAYNPDSLAYLGKLSQRAFKIPFKLVKGDAEDLLYNRPQKPIRPFPYTEEEVCIENKHAGIRLAGTFTKPAGSGRFPTVVLISGSGPQDRNETVMAHMPFLVLSDYLTRRGFAVLRCDDRGKAGSGGNFKGATTVDFAGDVEAELDYLKQRKDVDKKRMGLIGHSEGGLIAPMIAAKRKEVNFLVLMAAPAINMFELLLIQDSMILAAEGKNPKEIHRSVNQNKKLFEFLCNAKDSAAAADSIDAYLTNQQTPVKTIVANLEQLNSPWMRWFIHYDPRENLKRLKCSVLALNGEKDVQVPAAVNLASIENELRLGGNKNYQISMLPGLNHLFQKCTSCSVSEYISLDETMNMLALQTMGDWLQKNVMKK